LPALANLAISLGNPTAIEEFIRSRWVIVPDPYHAEFVRAPELQLRGLMKTGRLEGDCDDAAVFAAALLHSIGWPAVLIAIRKSNDENYSHVFTRTVFAPGVDFSEPAFHVDIDPIVDKSLLPLSGSLYFMELTV
jgi:hypothetical protein